MLYDIAFLLLLIFVSYITFDGYRLIYVILPAMIFHGNRILLHSYPTVNAMLNALFHPSFLIITDTM
jgi:hypothetical protein